MSSIDSKVDRKFYVGAVNTEKAGGFFPSLSCRTACTSVLEHFSLKQQ